MRKFLTLVLLVGLSGLALHARQQQQQPADPPSSQQEQQTDANRRQSAQTLQGKIARSGDQLVFLDSSQTAYQLDDQSDDQSKVAPYEGKTVKLMATVDPKTNSLHVIDIAPAEK
jgi:hypothetical protein